MYFVCLMPSGAGHLSARDDRCMLSWFYLRLGKNNDGSCKDLDSRSQDTAVIFYNTQWTLGTNDAFPPKETNGHRDIDLSVRLPCLPQPYFIKEETLTDGSRAGHLEQMEPVSSFPGNLESSLRDPLSA